MSSEIPKPAEIRRTRGYLWRRVFSKWPLLIWIGVAFLTYALYKRGVAFERVNGVVEAEVETIAALEDGTIDELTVNEIGEEVAPGTVVVKLDKRLALEEMKQLAREIELEQIQEELKYSTAKTELEAEIEQLKIKEEEDRAELALLEQNLETLAAQRERNLITQRELDDARLKVSTLRIEVGGYAKRIEKLEESLAKVTAGLQRLEEYNKGESVALRIAQDRIDRMDLQSTSGGKVRQIFLRKGAVVERGEPIVEIVNDERRKVRGFIPEKEAAKVNVGMPVYITTQDDTTKYYTATVQFIAPEITSTPDIGSSVAGRMLKGREVICAFDDPEVDLLPQRSVIVHLDKPGKFKPFTKAK